MTRDRRISHPQIALAIAGFDPSSGAGVTADLKTFSAHGIYGLACISALTVQSTQGVRSVEPLAPAVVRRTLACLSDDLAMDGVKIGMLATADNVREVASFLEAPGGQNAGGLCRSRIVLDPVLASTSGALLLDVDGVELLRTRLLSIVGWITPNRSELAVLTESLVSDPQDMAASARLLQQRAAQLGNPELNVVVTGGDLERPEDYVLLANGEEVWLPGEHIETPASHGTGCAFSSAMLCALVNGLSPLEAVRSAKEYVAGALRNSPTIGQGKGPLDHFFRFHDVDLV
jgi:hydroxymethylpyrimidine/phosphomethylpyrimidine kinase